MADYTLSAKGVYDGSKFDGPVKKSGSAVDSLKNKCKSLGSSIAGVAAKAAVALGAATSAVSGFAGKFAMDAVAAAEQADIAFSTMLGPERAKEMLAELADFAASTPFELQGLQSSTQKLIAMGFAAEDCIPLLTSIGDAASGLGAGQEGIDSITRSLGQMNAKGKVQAEEMMQLTEVGIPAWEYLAAAISDGDVPAAMDKVTKGAVDAKTAISALKDGMDSDFGGMMSAQSKTLSGILSNMADAAYKAVIPLKDTSAYGELTDAMAGMAERIEPFVSSLMPAFEGAMGAAAGGVKLLAGAMDKAPAVVSKVRGAISDAGTALKGFAALWKMGETPLESFGLVAANAMNHARQLVDGFVSSAVQRFPQLQGPVDAARAAFDGIKEKVGEFKDALSSGEFDGVAAALPGIAAAVGSLALGFGAVAPAVAHAVGAVVGFVGKLGGVSGVVSTVGGAIAGIGSKIGGLSSAFSLAGGGLKGLLAVIGGLASPVALVVTAIAALAAGFSYMMTTNEGFRETVVQLVSSIGSSLAPVLQTVGQAVAQLATTVLPVIMSLIQALLPVLGQIGMVILQVAAALAPVVAMILSTVIPIVTQVLSLVVTTAASIMSAVLPVISAILSAIQVAMPVIQAVVTAAMSVVLGIIQAVWPIVQSVVTTVAGVIQGAVRTAMSFIQTTISFVMAIVQGDWEGAWEVVSSALESAWEGIQSGVQSGIDAVMGFVGEIQGKVTGFFADAGSWLIDSGKAIVQGLADGISGAVQSVTDAVGGVLSAARDFLPFSPAKEGPFSGRGWTLYSGRSIVSALAEGVSQRQSEFVAALEATMSVGGMALSGASATYSLDGGTDRATTGNGRGRTVEDDIAAIRKELSQIRQSMPDGVYMDGRRIGYFRKRFA